MSRPPNPLGARTARITVRVKPSARAAFKEAAERVGITESEALREALNMWMKRRAR